MKLLSLGLAFLAILVGGTIGIDRYTQITETTQELTIENRVAVEIPNTKPLSVDNKIQVPEKDTIKVMLIEDRNSVVLRGAVTRRSVSKWMAEIAEKDALLDSDKPLYLVIDSPGGSVFDGLNFIDFLHALDREINTVNLYSASMAFHIAQNMDKRFIQRAGSMMSHRATLGGLGGQLDGEFETRYAMIMRKVNYLDAVAANRMEMDVNDYKELIKPELWVDGTNAIQQNVADETVLIKCGESMLSNEDISVRTMFGNVIVTVSRCPLIKGILNVRMIGVKPEHKEEVKSLVEQLFVDKDKFVKQVIVTGDFDKYFK